MNVALAIAAVLSGLFSIFLFSIPATPRTPRRMTGCSQATKVQFVDKDIDHPDRIILGHIVVETLGKQRLLPTVRTLNEAAHTHLLLTSGG